MRRILLGKRNQEAETAADLEVRMKSERFEQIDPSRIPEKPVRRFRWQ